MSLQKDLLTELLKINVFKLGKFNLKTGGISPFYVDVRHVPSFPKVFTALSDALYEKLINGNIEADVLCGVPYAALPLAAAITARHDKPLIIKRKERKSHGTSKLIEGVFKQGDTCVIIEDIVVSGLSIAETVLALRAEGLIVKDCVTVLDRLQGGVNNLNAIGVTLHSLFTIRDMLEAYCLENTVEDSTLQEIEEYLQDNVCTLPQEIQNGHT